MREILFRAKTEPCCKDVVTGEIVKKPKWIYGYIDLGYMRDGQGAIISDEKGNKAYRCQYSTIGQYTGLTDKNGKRIFEGDVVYDGFTKDKVVFEDCQWKLVDRHGMWINLFNREVEVIGNIYDNPELLEGGTDAR